MTTKCFISSFLLKGIVFSLIVAFLASHFLLDDTQVELEQLARQHWNETQPHIVTISLVTLLGMFAWLIFHYASQPIYIINAPDKKEHIPNGKLLARAARSRKSGNIPHPFPTGWYRVEDATVLKPGELKYIEFLGEHLVLYRGENGKAAILDAYCPHLGANIAVEGKVVGDCVECPFHGWRFKEDGKCTFIPYTDKVPEIAKTRSWPVHEVNGSIYMWFDALGRLDNIPWYLPELPEVQQGKFVFHGAFENYVEAHIQEIPENGSDIAHLGVLHVPFVYKWLQPFLSHKWSANWTAGEAPEEHIANITLTAELLLFGKLIPFTRVTSKIKQIGPAVVYLELQSNFGKFYVSEHVTPMQPLFQKINHCIYGENKFLSRVVAQTMLRAFCVQFNRDVAIWNNKTYVVKPIIVKNDGNILGFRRFYSKFYPDIPNDSKDTMDW